MVKSWSDNDLEKSARLFNAGWTPSKIAPQLEGAYTRNAVIGSLNRRGLRRSGRTEPTPRTPARPKPAPRPRGRPPGQRNVCPAEAPSPGELASAARVERRAAPTIIELETPAAQRVTLLQLNADTCRWPIGDPGAPDFFFCGARPLGSLPYCSHHSRVAYQPAGTRTAKRPFIPAR